LSSTLTNLLSASLGAFAATIIRIPQEEIKVACQSAKYPNAFVAVTSLYGSSGLFGFYRNAPIIILRDVLWHSLSYSLFHFLKTPHNSTQQIDRFSQRTQGRNEILLGTFVGALACLLTHPLDVIRTVLMVDSSRTPPFPSHCCVFLTLFSFLDFTSETLDHFALS
jgi:hypothetical protein